MKLYPLIMKPHFSERPWGGRSLKDSLGKEIPAEKQIGESWELSDHPNGKSTIANGTLAGKEFGEVLRDFPVQMMNRENVPDRYPLLVKFISAEDDLSIQVHPEDTYAAKLNDRGKTECWYVMDTKPNTEIIFGLEEGVTKDQLEQGSKTGEIEKQVARHPVAKDDFLFVRAGTVHAILGGTLICEIQQSSDTTFRLWDWNRKPERELHILQSLDVIDWNAGKLEPEHVPQAGNLENIRELTDNEFFRVRVFDVQKNNSQSIPDDIIGNGLILIALSGSGSIEAKDCEPCEFEKGATVFLPAELGHEASISNQSEEIMRVLLAESRE